MTPTDTAFAASEHARVVWLVDGDDATLISEAIEGLVEGLVGDADRALVLEDFRSDDLDLGAVVVACQTPPFLAERRVVSVRDIGRFSTEDLAPLLSYLEDPLPTTCLVLGAGGGRLAPKLLAAVKQHGHVQGTAVAGKEARSWLRQRIRESSVNLDGPAEALLEAHLGEDVSRLPNVLGVLVAAYGEGAHLGPDEIAPYLGEAGSMSPWELTDAIDSGRTEAALVLLRRLVGSSGRHPLVVLATLHRHAQSVLRVAGPGIANEAGAAAALGIAKGRSTFPAKKALSSAKRIGSSGAGEMIELIADAEVALKGSSEWPGEVVLEVLVARLCRISRGGAGSRPGAQPRP